jgi:hypothetical protein
MSPEFQRRRVAEVRAKVIWNESGNGDLHGGDSPSLRGGIGDCDGDSKRGAGEITLMLLSNVPFAH